MVFFIGFITNPATNIFIIPTETVKLLPTEYKKIRNFRNRNLFLLLIKAGGCLSDWLYKKQNHINPQTFIPVHKIQNSRRMEN